MGKIKAVLVGLPDNHSMIPPDKQQQVTEGLASCPKLAAEAGFEYEFVAIDEHVIIEALKAQLQAAKPDAVCIGGGLRFLAPLTPLFEKVVNAIKDAVPHALILFNTSPGDIVQAVRRNFDLPPQHWQQQHSAAPVFGGPGS